jgi:uncharacterized repeat protein (TIGR01451 family)
MKKYWSIVSLMAAMAVSAAGAVGTPAGTKIENKATLTFSDAGGTTQPPIDSPIVVTTVKAVPSFVLTKDDASTVVTTPDYTKPGQTNSAAKPGDTIVFPYVLTNTGNVPKESYDLGNQAPDAASGVKPGTGVLYFLKNPDTNNDGVVSPAELTAAGTPITTLTGLDPDQKVEFFQVYTVPTDAKGADKYGADPTGTRKDNPLDGAIKITLAVDANNSNTATVVRNDGGVIGPKTDPTAAGGAPAYPSPEGVIITPDKDGRDSQTANATVTTGVITFTNTIKNNGNRPDTFTVAATPTDFPAGSKVELFNPDGTTPFTVTPNLAPGATADVLVKVTFPAGVPVTDPTKKPTVGLVVTSGNDNTKTDPTKDIVNLPGLKFGDAPGTGTAPDPAPVTPATPKNPDAKDPTAVSLDPKVCTTTTSTSDAYLAMGVRNLGTLNDRFVISGTSTITLTNGTTTPVTVTYFKDTNSNGVLDAGETALPSVAGGQDVGILAPNELVKLIAVIPVPCAAAQGTYKVVQNVKSVDPTDPGKPGTGVAGVDENDTVKVGGNGQVPTIDKARDKAEAAPGEVITYTITATNKTNNNVTKAIVKDTVPANTTYSALSATSTSTGKVLYSADGTTWTAGAPATATTVYVGVDTNTDGNITTADVLKPGETINVTFKVKIN